MTQDLTVRDVFHQVDARLGRVEDDVRSLRTEMNDRFYGLRGDVNTRFDSVDRRFDRLHAMFVSLVIGIGGLVIAVVGLWFKM
jgi:hypothetical protein